MLALRCIRARLDRGEPALLVSFEEALRTFRRRAAGVGMAVDDDLASGTLIFVEIDAAETSAGKISDMVRQRIGQGIRSVIINSLAGYRHALRDDTNLLRHMHGLLTDLADAVLLVRYFAAADEIRCAVSVIKKRTGAQRTMRELYLDDRGLRVGPRLTGFRDILASRPVYVGTARLLGRRDGAATA